MTEAQEKSTPVQDFLWNTLRYSLRTAIISFPILAGVTAPYALKALSSGKVNDLDSAAAELYSQVGELDGGLAAIVGSIAAAIFLQFFFKIKPKLLD